MNPTYYQHMFPRALEEELETTWAGREFMRRAFFVLDESTKAWVLYGCALKPANETQAVPNESYEFERAIMKADSVAAAELKGFFGNPAGALSALAGKAIAPEFYPQCQCERVTLQNYWMKTPGAVYKWGAQGHVNSPPGELLSPDGPYYPDVDEAAKDWLGLAGHAGQGDGFKGQVLLLLPETRAFIRNHSWSEDDEHLHLEIAGSALHAHSVTVKGAYWCDKTPTQVEQVVADGAATVFVPRKAERLDLNLVSADGTVYEQHRENLNQLGGKRFLGSRHRMTEDRVKKALKAGEGVQIEFKPFVPPPKTRAALSPEHKTKMDEVLATVVSFANADGGTIFIGVTNDVRAAGFREDFARHYGTRATKELVETYARELQVYVRDEMYLPTQVDVSALEHEGEVLVLVEVPSAKPKYVSLKKDPRLLRRHGASNRSVPPDEWSPRERDFFGNQGGAAV